MKYNETKDSLYLTYSDKNNLYGLALYQNFLVKSTNITEIFFKNYNKNKNVRYILKGGINYLKQLGISRNKLSFLTEQMKSNNKEKIFAT